MDDRVRKLYEGEPINCTKEEYDNGLRDEIQQFAGKMVDDNQGIRAVIALEEVRRLDKIFSVTLT